MIEVEDVVHGAVSQQKEILALKESTRNWDLWPIGCILRKVLIEEEEIVHGAVYICQEILTLKGSIGDLNLGTTG